MSTTAEKEKRETFWTKTEKETLKETYGTEILVLVKDKRLTEKYKITKDVVSAAYPQIVWGGRS